MSDEEKRAAVSLHMLLTRESKEQTCKNCGHKIVKWTLPQGGVFKEEAAWYHVCIDPMGIVQSKGHDSPCPLTGHG